MFQVNLSRIRQYNTFSGNGLFLVIPLTSHYMYHSVILFYKPSLFIRTVTADPLPTYLLLFYHNLVQSLI